MAYVLQSFSSGAILTNSQLWQTEENIATHVHGLSGVAGAGVSIKREDKTQAFTVQPSDSGKLFDCYVPEDTYAGTFQPAGTLGNDFSIMIKNRDATLPVLLLAASGQTIDGRSGYLLCPLESVSVFSNSEALYTNLRQDPVTLFSESLPTSLAEIEISLLNYAAHFSVFEIEMHGVKGAGGANSKSRLRISVDSLTSYLGDGLYSNTGFGSDTNFIALQGTSAAHDYFYRVRFNQGNEGGTRIFPVFNVSLGTGYTTSYSDSTEFASVTSAAIVSGSVVHGLIVYSSGDYMDGVSGAGYTLRAYGRK